MHRTTKNQNTPAKLKAPISVTHPNKIKLALQQEREKNKLLQQELQQIKKSIDTSSQPISKDVHKDFVKIFSEHSKKHNISPFMKLFWEEQQKYLSTSKKGIRYHPMVIKYCLNLASKSPSVYEELRHNEKDGTGVLILPSQRRLRDYKNYIKPERGFNPKIIKELIQKTKSFSAIERNICLTFDEMKIQDDLVWDKHTGELIGYVD